MPEAGAGARVEHAARSFFAENQLLSRLGRRHSLLLCTPSVGRRPRLSGTMADLPPISTTRKDMQEKFLSPFTPPLRQINRIPSLDDFDLMAGAGLRSRASSATESPLSGGSAKGYRKIGSGAAAPPPPRSPASSASSTSSLASCFELAPADTVSGGGGCADPSSSKGRRPRRGCPSPSPRCLSAVNRGSGIVIALMLTLLDAVPYGMIVFPRAMAKQATVGVSMFLVTTAISQVTYTCGSYFAFGLGSMMVENIPFLHAMATDVHKNLDSDNEILSTVLVCYALATVLSGIAFLLVGYLGGARLMHYFVRR